MFKIKCERTPQFKYYIALKIDLSKMSGSENQGMQQD